MNNDCIIHLFSSRACERGTHGCVVRHNDLSHRLTHCALFFDSIWHPGDWKRVENETPEERARYEAMRRFRDQPRPAPRPGRPKRAVFVSTGGKSKAEIVTDTARQLKLAGMLKETPPIAHEDSRPSDKKLPR